MLYRDYLLLASDIRTRHRHRHNVAIDIGTVYETNTLTTYKTIEISWIGILGKEDRHTYDT